MAEVSLIGIDLAKQVFHLHGAAADGTVVFRKKLSREQLLTFLGGQAPCVVAMEACASAHYWAREIACLGHEVRLVAPIYVKPFRKRQKNDVADAEAIAEATARPTMRFVAVKTAEQQARAMLYRTRDMLVRQRTQLINAFRGHLAEHGLIAPQGPGHVKRLAEALAAASERLPALVRELGSDLLAAIDGLDRRIAAFDKRLRAEARAAAIPALLQSVPGVGPITVTAIEAFAPPLETFRRGRDFAAWLGLVPRQHSTGGKERLGGISKMGQRDIRRLLIIGAMAVVRWAERRSSLATSWLLQLLARKPRMLAAVALANKMARTVWAIATSGQAYRDPATA